MEKGRHSPATFIKQLSLLKFSILGLLEKVEKLTTWPPRPNLKSTNQMWKIIQCTDANLQLIYIKHFTIH